MTVTMLEEKLKPFEDPLSHPLAKWLYLHFPPRPILSRKMHDHYSQAMNILMRELEAGHLTQNMRDAIHDYIQSASPFLADYERKEFPLKSIAPEEVLRFLMEENNLTQYDLASDLGGQPVVSDILGGKRKLTRDHIERLSKRFGISPATFFPAEEKAIKYEQMNPLLSKSHLNEPKAAGYHARAKKPVSKKHKKIR